MVYKFDPYEERIQKMGKTVVEDKFLMGMGITDGKMQVATLGEQYIHLFDGENWKILSKEISNYK